MAEQYPVYVFVYGTLMRGGGLHPYLADRHANFVCNAKIRAKLYDVAHGAFPGATPSDLDWTHGEVYQLVDNADETAMQQLLRLDRVEGCEFGLYGRYLVAAWSDTDSKLTPKVWVYFYGRPVDESLRIADGRWHNGGKPEGGAEVAA